MRKPATYELFLRIARSHCDVNAHDEGWLDRLARTVHGMKPPERRSAFKAELGRALVERSLTPRMYEKATGWYFDTEAEYFEHLRTMWDHLYPDESPQSQVDTER